MNAFLSFRRVGLMLTLVALLFVGGSVSADSGAGPHSVVEGKVYVDIPPNQSSCPMFLRNATGRAITDIEVCSRSGTDEYANREISRIDILDAKGGPNLDTSRVRPVEYNGPKRQPGAPLPDDDATISGVSWNPDEPKERDTSCVDAVFTNPVPAVDDGATKEDDRDFQVIIKIETADLEKTRKVSVQPTVADAFIARTITNGDASTALASATAGQAIGDIVIQELGAGALALGLVMIGPVTPGFVFSGHPTAVVEMGDIAVASPIVVGGEIQLPIKSYGKFPGLIKLSHLQVDTDATFPETTQASVLAGVRSQPAGVTEESFVIADTRGSGKPANVRFWLPLVMRNYTPPSRGYVYLAEGSLAVLRTAQTTESEPLYGYLTLAWSWGLSNSGSFNTGGGAGAGKVNIQDLSFTLPASAPLGLLQVELAEPAELVVGPDLSAKGLMSLRVWLPLHDVTLTAVGMAQLQNVSGLYQRLLLDFTLEPGSPLLEPTYQVGFSAGLELDVVTEDEIRKLIEKLDYDGNDPDKLIARNEARTELRKIGKPALPELKKALAGPPPPTPEQKTRLLKIIEETEGVVTADPQWTGTEEDGFYTFTFTVTAATFSAALADKRVCDLHFRIPKREPSVIDHSKSDIILEPKDKPGGWPENWSGSYNADAGEYRFEYKDASGKCVKPLVKGVSYKITIVTKPPQPPQLPLPKSLDPGDMVWYWTTKVETIEGKWISEPIGDVGTTKGPVFPKPE
jgi:hypothetical protein